MPCFHNILAGVDLSHCTSPDAADLDPITRDTVHRALWLTRANSARLTFFAALGAPEQAFPGGEEASGPGGARTVADAAARVLDDLVRQARDSGVEAQGQCVSGKDWVEIIRQVVRGQHDLVLVGWPLHHFLIGSTARKLLRDCPCPVWVARPSAEDRPLNVLVASNLTPLADHALRLALALGQSVEARIHVLHVVSYPLDQVWSTGLPDPATEQYHHQVRAGAEQALRAELERTGYRGTGPSVHTHLADSDGLPDHAILQFINDHAIDLLVIGETGRHGLARLLKGDAADRLLPDLPCSVLVVKPPDFQSLVD